MERKTYTKPDIKELDICGCSMVCTSITISDEETNSGGRAQERKEENWGNLWN